MLVGGEIPDLVECMDAKTIRVHAPTAVLFLCGGQRDLTAPKPKSLRDAFLRIHDEAAFRKYDVLIAEDLNAFFPKGNYKDILSFESDFAQIAVPSQSVLELI